MADIQWIFFDLGGTLTDEREQMAFIVQSVRTAFASYGLSYSDEDVYRAMEKASSRYEQPEKTAIRYLAQNEEQYRAIEPLAYYNHDYELLFDGVPELLEKLSRKYRLGIIANQTEGGVARAKKNKIYHHISVFALSAELGVRKPDERIFRYALDQAGCPAERAVFVGDRLDNDIFPAKKLGFHTIRARQGVAQVQEPRDERYSADYTVESVADVARILLP